MDMTGALKKNMDILGYHLAGDIRQVDKYGSYSLPSRRIINLPMEIWSLYHLSTFLIRAPALISM